MARLFLPWTGPPLLALVLPLAQGDGGVSLGVLALLVIVGLGLVVASMTEGMRAYCKVGVVRE